MTGADKLPLELREARLNALRLALLQNQFPTEVTLPGGIIGGRAHAAQRLPFASREACQAMLDNAKARLIDDGVATHQRNDGSVQLLDRNFADPVNGPLAIEARKKRGWLGIGSGWLRGFTRPA